MATTAVTSLRLDPRRNDKRWRLYADTPIDALFDDLVRDANWAKGLIDFARGLYTENSTAKVDVSAVFAFVESVRMPMENVVDALTSIVFELKQREAERGA